MDADRYGRRIEAADDIIGRRLNGNPKHTCHHCKWYRTTIYTRHIVKVDKSRSTYYYHIILYYSLTPLFTYTTRRAQTKTIIVSQQLNNDKSLT